MRLLLITKDKIFQNHQNMISIFVILLVNLLVSNKKFYPIQSIGRNVVRNKLMVRIKDFSAILTIF